MAFGTPAYLITAVSCAPDPVASLASCCYSYTLDVQNNDGKTAVDRAREDGHNDVVEIISAHSPQPRGDLHTS